MLDIETTLQLIGKAQEGDENAKALLIEHNMPLIKSIAKHFKGRIEYDDLLQLGSMGLLKAINNFNTDYGVRFSTYAVPMIAGEIKRFLRDDGAIKVSRALKMQAVRIAKFVDDRKNETGDDPSIEEIATEMEMSPQDVVFAMDSSKFVVSIYDKIDEDGVGLVDRLASKSEDNEDALDRLMLKDKIADLPDRDKKIIILRYFRDKTQSEVAREMGVSQVQISRLENKILDKLRTDIS